MRTLFILFLALVLSGVNRLPAQVVPITVLEPSLGVAFPAKEEAGKIVVTYPVLLNVNDILPAGTVLRKLFPKPKKDDKDVKERKVREYDTGKYAVKQRLAIENREEDPNKSAIIKAVEQRAGGEAMASELKFRATLHRMDREEYYLSYSAPGAEELRIGQFDYPEGLFLSEQNGKIIVLAVVVDSLSQKLGIEAGSQLTAVGTTPVKSLADFRDHYFKEKEAKKEKAEPLVMTLIRNGEKTGKSFEFEAQRSLGNVSDMMSDMHTDIPKKEEPSVTIPPKKKTENDEAGDKMDVPLIP